MTSWKRFANWITGRADRDLERELRAHLDLESDEQQEAGIAPEDTRHARLRWRESWSCF
jgi:hypothetical protein